MFPLSAALQLAGRSSLTLRLTSVFLKHSRASLHTGQRFQGLLDFFDDPKNWGESRVTSGRPWRMEELRLKSNTDLHELWYVLLKERNMLMTMEEEHNRCLERMPNPERFEKVSSHFIDGTLFYHQSAEN
ncbi:39S ribosomal protein L47 mitochondrial [Fasciola hepatica]|uniref:Large ribosomal subunit protein uL29m n=1 Tax=Fasciola hepatica TaxID=6192 RepID=A0A4E0QTH3_FASHE|nr:39S ribosomal protein L47 mitochondrial [Fasciola hepatica]